MTLVLVGEVEAGDGARIAADVKEAAVGGDEHAARTGDRCHHLLGAGRQRDALDLAAGKLRYVGDAVGFVQRNLVDAVEAGGHHGGGGAVDVGEAEAEQCAGVFGDVGVKAIDAEFDIRRSVVAGADDGLDVGVGRDGAMMFAPASAI